MELVVNSKVFPHEKILKEWEAMKEKLKNLKNRLDEEKFYKITLDYTKDAFINKVLLEEEAFRVIEDVPYSEIKKKYREISEHFGGKSSLIKYFGDDSFDEFTIKENIENYLRVQALIKTWTEAKLNSTNDEELERFYKENQELFKFENHTILTRVTTGLSHKKEMEKLLSLIVSKNLDQVDQLLDKSSVFKVVKNMLIQKKSLNPEVEEIIFSLKLGENSKIIQAGEELHLFLKIQDVKNEFLDFKTIKSTVSEIFINFKKESLIQKKLKILKEQAKITFID